MGYKFKTTAKRSKLMQKIKGIGTTPELIFQKALKAVRIRCSKNNKKLPGKPDIVIPQHKIAIFLDGEFWHGYQWDKKRSKIKANRGYWIPKIEKNISRDKQNKKKLKEAGWKVVRFWQHQVNKDISECIKKIQKLMNMA